MRRWLAWLGGLPLCFLLLAGALAIDAASRLERLGHWLLGAARRVWRPDP